MSEESNHEIPQTEQLLQSRTNRRGFLKGLIGLGAMMSIPGCRTSNPDQPAPTTSIPPQEIPQPTPETQITVKVEKVDPMSEIGKRRIYENLLSIKDQLQLDAQEIQKYKETGEDADLKSFKVFYSADKTTGIVVATGGKNGLREGDSKVSNISWVGEAIKIINKYDPEMINKLTQEYHLKAISADIAPGDFFKNYPHYTYSYIKEGVILLNEKPNGQYEDIARPVLDIVCGIITEARGIHALNNLVNNESLPNDGRFYADKPVLDKSLFFQKWVDERKDLLNNPQDPTYNERVKMTRIYSELKARAETDVKEYSQPEYQTKRY